MKKIYIDDLLIIYSDVLLHIYRLIDKNNKKGPGVLLKKINLQ